MDDIDKLLINLFIHQMGFTYVVGTSLGRKLSLINEAQSLITKKENKELNNGPVLSSICPGWVLYAEKHILMCCHESQRLNHLNKSPGVY